jgi:hypothetical protein
MVGHIVGICQRGLYYMIVNQFPKIITLDKGKEMAWLGDFLMYQECF